jgi:hypothetical protein
MVSYMKKEQSSGFFARFSPIGWFVLPGIGFPTLWALFPLLVALRQAASTRAVACRDGAGFIGKKHPDPGLIGRQPAIRKTAGRQAAVQQPVGFQFAVASQFSGVRAFIGFAVGPYQIKMFGAMSLIVNHRLILSENDVPPR